VKTKQRECLCVCVSVLGEAESTAREAACDYENDTSHDPADSNEPERVPVQCRVAVGRLARVL